MLAMTTVTTRKNNRLLRETITNQSDK
jgi:hypothetical protein